MSKRRNEFVVPKHFVIGPSAMFGVQSPHRAIGPLPRPKYEIGDKRYLDADWPHPKQIRPLTTDDFMPAFQYGAGMWMVVVRIAGVGHLRPVVPLPMHLRSNTPANADTAWELAVGDTPSLARCLLVLQQLSKDRK